MYKRDVNLSLEDILESIEKIENYTNEISLDEFASNKLVEEIELMTQVEV